MDERALEQEIANRDAMEEAFSDAYELVMSERMEWSSAYGVKEALHDMEVQLDRERRHRPTPTV